MMKKRLFSIIFFAFLSTFTDFSLCNPAFHLTEAQKSWFDNLEKEWMEPFKKLANLDDQEMKLVVDTIADMKKQRFDWSFQSEKIKCYHDENIPKDVMQKMYRILQKHGINPYRIDIRTEKDNTSKWWYLTTTVAAASDSCCVFTGVQQGKITALRFTYCGQNPTLWIYQPCYAMNNENFEAVILHECGHFVEAHRGQRELLHKVLKAKNVPEKAREHFFDRFTCIIELIADQRLTIGNEERVKKMLSYHYNPMFCLFRHSKINYDNGYPSNSTCWASLKMMQHAFQKPNENRLMALYNKLRTTLGLVPC